MFLFQRSFFSRSDEPVIDDEGRVVVYTEAELRGSLHKSLKASFSKATGIALVAIPVNELTTFVFAIGSVRIRLNSDMNLFPTLETFKKYADKEHDNTFSVMDKDGRNMYIRLPSKADFNEWHKAVREALAELAFTDSFQKDDNNMLSIRKIESAIQRSILLVPPGNCHVLRAKKLWNLKMELSDLVHRIEMNEQTVSREEARAFIKAADTDRVGGDTYIAC
jgi:hypothetical protein